MEDKIIKDTSGDLVNFRIVNIEFVYRENCTCCQDIEKIVENAVAKLVPIFELTGIAVNYYKIHVRSEKEAVDLGLNSIYALKINGRDIDFEVQDIDSDHCTDGTGDMVWIYQGKGYSVPPVGMIIEGLLKAVYTRPLPRIIFAAEKSRSIQTPRDEGEKEEETASAHKSSTVWVSRSSRIKPGR